MNLKQGVRLIVFLLVFLCLFFYAANIFHFPESHISRRFHTFYEEEKNTLDAVYIGSSAVDRYWAAPFAWGNYGIAVYPLSSNAQPTAAVKFLIEESLKYQEPKLFIVDLRGTLKAPEDVSGVNVRAVTDNMKFSVNRLKAIDYLTDFAKISGSDVADYYLPFIKYHGRWDDGKGDGIGKSDFEEATTMFKGSFVIRKLSGRRIPFEEGAKPTEERALLEPEVEAVLRDLLVYCKEKNLDVLFVNSPYVISLEDRIHNNAVYDLINEYEYPVIEFNDKYQELGIDFQKDYYNPDHVNAYGAFKYTSYLSEYLIKQYGLEDKRSKPEYESWDHSYRQYAKYMKQILGKEEWNKVGKEK